MPELLVKPIRPEQFGAKGDGTTDDTAAIQAAIDAAKTGGGGVVYMRTGTYKLVPASGNTLDGRPYALRLPSGVTLRGAGRGGARTGPTQGIQGADSGATTLVLSVPPTSNAATIAMTDASAGAQTSTPANGAYLCNIYDVCFTTSAEITLGTSPAIFAPRYGSPIVFGCRFRNHAYGVFIGTLGTDHANFSLVECIADCSRLGYAIDSLDCKWRGIEIAANTAAALNADLLTLEGHCEGWSFTDIELINYKNAESGDTATAGACLRFKSNATGFPRFNEAKGVYCDSGKYGLYIEAGALNVFDSTCWASSRGASGTGTGVTFGAGASGNVWNGRIFNTKEWSIEDFGTDNMARGVMSNNGKGIRLGSSCVRGEYEGNTIRDLVSGFYTLSNAFQIDAGATNCNVSNNKIGGLSLTDNGTGTRKTGNH